VKRHAQVQEPLGPRLQSEVHDPLLVEVVDDLLEDHAHKLLPVLVRAFIPQRDDHVDQLHAHAQLNSRLLHIRGPRLPVDDVTLTLNFALEVLFAADVTIAKEVTCRFNLPAQLGDSSLLLTLEVIVDGAGTAVLSLNSHLHQERQLVFPYAQDGDEPLEIILDDMCEHGTVLAATLDAFRMAVAQLAILVHATQSRTQLRAILFDGIDAILGNHDMRLAIATKGEITLDHLIEDTGVQLGEYSYMYLWSPSTKEWTYVCHQFNYSKTPVKLAQDVWAVVTAPDGYDNATGEPIPDYEPFRDGPN